MDFQIKAKYFANNLQRFDKMISAKFNDSNVCFIKNGGLLIFTGLKSLKTKPQELIIY